MIGQKINYDSKTGDFIMVDGIIYRVIDTYPEHILVDSGRNIGTVGYVALCNAGAEYVIKPESWRKDFIIC